MLNEDILKAIESNLSSQVAGVLNKRLMEGEGAIKKVSECLKTIAKLEEEKKELSKKVLEADYLNRFKKELDAKSLEIESKERKMLVFELKTRLEESDKRSQIMKELVSLLFRNQEIRINKSGYTPMINSSGCQCQEPFSENTVVTKDKL